MQGGRGNAACLSPVCYCKFCGAANSFDRPTDSLYEVNSHSGDNLTGGDGMAEVRGLDLGGRVGESIGTPCGPSHRHNPHKH